MSPVSCLQDSHALCSFWASRLSHHTTPFSLPFPLFSLIHFPPKTISCALSLPLLVSYLTPSLSQCLPPPTQAPLHCPEKLGPSKEERWPSYYLAVDVIKAACCSWTCHRSLCCSSFNQLQFNMSCLNNCQKIHVLLFSVRQSIGDPLVSRTTTIPARLISARVLVVPSELRQYQNVPSTYYRSRIGHGHSSSIFSPRLMLI